MLIVISYCLKDQELALRNMALMTRLKQNRPHKFFVTHDSRCAPSRILNPIDTLSVIDPYSRWPESPNLMISETARYLEWKHPEIKYFLFLEADAIPIGDFCFDKIENEYLQTKKKFMGALVSAWKTCPAHLSGVAVYPSPLVNYAGMLVLSAGQDVPFDIADEGIVPQAHFTDLIQNKGRQFEKVNGDWHSDDPEPTFSSWSEFYEIATRECVLFHSDKRGMLIDLQLKDLAAKQRKRGDAPSSTQSTIKVSAAPTVQSVSAATTIRYPVNAPDGTTVKTITRHPVKGEISNGMVFKDGGWRKAETIDKLRWNAARARAAKKAKQK